MASAELQQELIGNYINTSANVLFLYDSIVTLCEEIDIIWRRKWTAMTWLFAFTRYVAIVDIILTFTSPGGAQSCAALLFTGDALLLLQYLCLASFSALRVHALLDGRYITAGVVLLLNLIPFAVNMFAFITDTTILDPEVCTEVYSGSASRGLLLSLLSRVSVIVGDVIVLAVTWAKTAQLYREARRLNIEAPLARMLICDGTLYFIILLMINVLDALGENVPILFNLGAVVSFFNILPSLIVCRFILNLRQVEPAGSSSSVSGNQSQSIRFVGNMGQSLQFGAAEEEEEDELEGDNNLTQANTNTLSGGSSTAEKCGATNEIEVVDVRLHSSV